MSSVPVLRLKLGFIADKVVPGENAMGVLISSKNVQGV